MNRTSLCSASHQDRVPFLRVTANGFSINDNLIPSFSALPLDATLVRKRFSHGKLVCYSSDGNFSKDGSPCSQCHQIDDCSSRFRLRLKPDVSGIPSPVFLELNFSSSRNFLAYLRRLSSLDFHPAQIHTTLSIKNRGHWGEVFFSINPSFLADHLLPLLE